MPHGCPGISGYGSEVPGPKGQRSSLGLVACCGCVFLVISANPCWFLPVGKGSLRPVDFHGQDNCSWLSTCCGGIALPVSWGYPSIPVCERAASAHRNIQVPWTRPLVMGSLDLVLCSHLSISCSVSQAYRHKAFPDQVTCYSKVPLTGKASCVRIF